MLVLTRKIGEVIRIGDEVTVQVLRSRLDSQYDGGDAFDDRTVTTLTAWQAGLADRFAPGWQSRLTAGEGQDDSVSKTGFGDYPFRTRQRQYTWQNDLAALPIPGRAAVALERRRSLPVRLLSQGQRRRIGLARLRLSRRALWILDEPLTALDDEGIDVLRGLLETHLEGGGTCVAASHQPLPIARERQQALQLDADRSALAGSAIQ